MAFISSKHQENIKILLLYESDLKANLNQQTVNAHTRWKILYKGRVQKK